MPTLAGGDRTQAHPRSIIRSDRMIDLSRLDLEEIATALSDQTNYEHH